MSNKPEVKIGINHQPIKEYNVSNVDNSRIVYMNNGDNFEILIHNTLRETVGVLITLNGQLLSHSYIVLYPGQSYWLDGDPEKHKKFHFTEYSVEKNQANLDAIANNGKVQVQFFKELKPTPNMTSIPPMPYWSEPQIYGSPRQPFWYGSTGDIKVEPDENMWRTAPNQFYSQTLTGNAGDSLVDLSDGRATLDVLGYMDNSNELTGRVDLKGDSEQRFDTVDVNFEYSPSYTNDFRILPKAKQILPKDIKVYCKCSRRKRKNENFCPNCGHRW